MMITILLKCANCGFERSFNVQADKVKPEWLDKKVQCPQCSLHNAGISIVSEKFKDSEVISSNIQEAQTKSSSEEVNALETERKRIIITKPMKLKESLFKRYYQQDLREVFAFFHYDYTRGENWVTPFQLLAKMAKNEDWDFQRPEFRRENNPLPILQNYLNYTFLRLQQQNKISFTKERACFNTGLQTPDEKDIFAVFSKNSRDVPDWYFDGWFDSYHYDLRNHFTPLPEIASYVEDASDLVFDITYDIEVQIVHILDDKENQERLPPAIRDNRTLAMAAIQGATEFLKQKCIRNYKTAIPFWYHPEGKIQLLLPLCLTKPDHADLALVADKDREGKVYRIRTALRMDMAYNNARLITRPDREWLNP